MDISEKRGIVSEYCRQHPLCEGCALPVGGWTKTFLDGKCLSISIAPEQDLDRALSIIGYNTYDLTADDIPDIGDYISALITIDSVK